MCDPGLDETLAKMQREGTDDGSARDAVLSAIVSLRAGDLHEWELHLILRRLTAAPPADEET